MLLLNQIEPFDWDQVRRENNPLELWGYVDSGYRPREKTFWEKTDDIADDADLGLSTAGLVTWINPLTAAGLSIASGVTDLYQLGRAAYKLNWKDVGVNATEILLDATQLKALKMLEHARHTKKIINGFDLYKPNPKIAEQLRKAAGAVSGVINAGINAIDSNGEDDNRPKLKIRTKLKNND